MKMKMKIYQKNATITIAIIVMMFYLNKKEKW